MERKPLPPVLPTPRTYRELVCELREALPQRLTQWLRSNPGRARAPGLAAMLERGEDPSTLLVQDPHASKERSKPPTAPVQYTVGGNLDDGRSYRMVVHFKINRGAIQVRGGGGYIPMEDWLQRTAPTLERRLGITAQHRCVSSDARGGFLPASSARSPWTPRVELTPVSGRLTTELTPVPPPATLAASPASPARRVASIDSPASAATGVSRLPATMAADATGAAAGVTEAKRSNFPPARERAE